MANDLELKARDAGIMACYVRNADGSQSYVAPSSDADWFKITRAVMAALRQAQPRPRCDDCHEPAGPIVVCETCAAIRCDAVRGSQQPGAQAAARVTLRDRHDTEGRLMSMCIMTQWEWLGDANRITGLPAGVHDLYLAPPPPSLPDVSDEDATEASLVHFRTRGNPRECMRAALESYRARHAKGGA